MEKKMIEKIDEILSNGYCRGSNLKITHKSMRESYKNTFGNQDRVSAVQNVTRRTFLKRTGAASAAVVGALNEVWMPSLQATITSGAVTLDDGPEGLEAIIEGEEGASLTVSINDCDVIVNNGTSEAISGDIKWDEFKIYLEGVSEALSYSADITWTNIVSNLGAGLSQTYKDALDQVLDGIDGIVEKVSARAQFVGNKTSAKKELIKITQKGRIEFDNVTFVKSSNGNGQLFLTVSCKYKTTGTQAGTNNVKAFIILYQSASCGSAEGDGYDSDGEDFAVTNGEWVEKTFNVREATAFVSDHLNSATTSGELYFEPKGQNISGPNRRYKVEKAGKQLAPVPTDKRWQNTP